MEPQRNGGPLDAARRNRLAGSSFALPGRRYPINDPNHARNALARGAQNASPDELARIRAAVHAKYPGIK
jgi:hypothetical protein